MRQSGNPRKKLTFADLSPYVPYEAVKEQQADRAELGPASTDAGRGSSPTAVSGLNLSGAGLTRVVLPSTWFFLTELFLQKNALTSLPALLGGLRHLRLLDVSYNNLVSLPLELGLLYELRDLNVSCNRLTELVPDIFGRLCRLESCQHEGNPLVSPPAHVLGGGAYALFRYCCDCMSAIAPPERQLRHVMAERDQAQMMAQGAARVSVLCYNILAEIYATQERHSYCPTWALAWSYRRGRVLAEILSHAADVVCLQEVETQQYHEFFAPNLAAAGYEGVFQAKSRSRSMAGDGGRVDGCAIFWKQSVFVLVEEHVIEFQNEASFRSEEFAGEGLNRLILKDNVALLVLLELWSTRQRVLVANTHIHWDPSFSDVKLVQTKMFLEKLAELQRVERTALLVCGDFNSLPDSGVFDLITKGSLTRDHRDLRNHSYGSYSRDGMRHDLALASCYPPEATPYTNCTHDFKGVLDYIFVSAESVRVASILNVVPLEHLPLPALPNAHAPSDHVLLYAIVFIRR